jgi:MFS family permease
LSLKYSTIEACFSVPMLNLTLPNLPFMVAFAVKGLGWQAGAVGLMAALPHLCNCVQPLLLAGLSRRYSNYQILLLSFALGALPWGLAGTLPALGPARDAFFTGILLLATLASSVATVAWSAGICEVVPPRISGRYFARRNLIYGGWTLVAVMAAGHIVEWDGNSMRAFCAIFCLAAISRMLGLFFLTRMRFPAAVMERRSRGLAPADLWAATRDPNYRRLFLFVGLWGLLLNMAMPFYTLYLVNELNLGVGTVVKLTTLGSLGGLVTLKGWGRLADRFGNRPVLQLTGLIWAATAAAMWALAHPGLVWPTWRCFWR